ncbi:MAG: dockerin type I repeat-containing protein [Prevotella sp.]|nr:dockerin type I repeat-containing protein [Prevotella sp.]
MKKFLLLLCTLLGTAGAWAQVTMPTLTTDTNNPVLYCIQSFRSYYFEQYAGDNEAITPTYDFSSENAKFYFVAVNGSNFDEGVKIVSNVNGKQLVEVGTGFAEEGTTWYIKENPYNAGFVCISKTSDLSSGCWDCNSNGVMTTNYWQPYSNDYEGTSWSIVEVPQYETSTLENPKWYYLKTGRGRYVYADGTNTGTNTSNPKTDAYKFAFISVGGTGVNIVSKAGLGGNQYLTTEPSISSTAAIWYYFGAARYPGYFLFSDDASGFGYPHLLNDNGAGGLAKWYVDGTGSYFQVEEAVSTCDVTYTYTYGGNTYTATERQDIGAPVSLPASITFPYTNYSFSTNVVPNAASAIVNVTIDSFNMPFVASTDYANATWYYMNGHAYYDGTYYISTDGNSIIFNTGMSRTDAYKWAFIGNPIEGIKVINKATGSGYYIDGTNPATMTNTAKSWVLKQQTNTSYHCGEKGFGLYDANLNYLNCRTGDNNLQYWTSFDTGSTFWVDDVDAMTSDKNALDEAIAVAQTLVDNTGVPGYPTAEAAATLNGVLTTAKSVYADASGDYGAAFNNLAEAINAAASNINYTPRTDVYYTITSARGSMVYDASHDSSTDADGNNFLWYTTSLDNTNKDHLWGFIEKDGNYYMYNVGKRQFATVSTSGTYQFNDKGTWVFSDTPAYVTFDAGINNSVDVPYVRVRATLATTGSTYSMSISTGYTGPVITYDAQGDGGIPMALATSSVAVDAEVTAAIEALLDDLTPYRNALKDVIDECASIHTGTAIGLFADNATYTAALTAANAVYNDPSATKSDLQTARNNLEEAKAGLILNTPSAGYYRVKNVATGKYLTAISQQGYNSATKGVYANGDASSAATIIKLEEKADGYYMYNQGAGFGWVATNHGSGYVYVTNSPDKYLHWFPGNEAGQIAFAICLGNGTGDYASYLLKGIYSTDSEEAVVGCEDYTADAAQWIFEEATDFSIALNTSIDGSYYTTFCAPFDMTLNGATAYTVAKGEGEELTTRKVSGTIAAGTPVLLVATSNSASATIGTNYSTAISTETALTGSYLEIAEFDGATNYILGSDGTKAGFFHSDGTTLKANTAYIAGDESTSSIEAFYFDLDTPEGQGGDVNNDSKVTIADVTALVNIILGKDDSEPYQYDHVAADVNNDGKVTIADVTALVNIILGKKN